MPINQHIFQNIFDWGTCWLNTTLHQDDVFLQKDQPLLPQGFKTIYRFITTVRCRAPTDCCCAVPLVCGKAAGQDNQTFHTGSSCVSHPMTLAKMRHLRGRQSTRCRHFQSRFLHSWSPDYFIVYPAQRQRSGDHLPIGVLGIPEWLCGFFYPLRSIFTRC